MGTSGLGMCVGEPPSDYWTGDDIRGQKWGTSLQRGGVPTPPSRTLPCLLHANPSPPPPSLLPGFSLTLSLPTHLPQDITNLALPLPCSKPFCGSPRPWGESADTSPRPPRSCTLRPRPPPGKAGLNYIRLYISISLGLHRYISGSPARWEQAGPEEMCVEGRKERLQGEREGVGERGREGL